MPWLSRKNVHSWIAPGLTSLIFLVPLVFLIPYATSYGTTKVPLGTLIMNLCKFGQTTQQFAALDYTYCLLVPPIVAYLVFLKKDEIAAAPLQGTRTGFWLLLLGVFVYWFGIRAEMQYYGYAAIQILLAGIVLWFWGWAVFRKLLFPWAFFLFAWPMPFLDPIIAFPLRMIMSGLAGKILNLVGIPTIQNGTGLLSAADPATGLAMGARFHIDIADPCSGIRSLFALLMFSALLAYLFVPKLWQQWALFLAAFPLAILGNLCRVLLLVMGCILFGSNFAIGTDENPSNYHEGCGFVVYAVALGIEFLLAELISRYSRPKSTSAPLAATA
jgi:exosortase